MKRIIILLAAALIATGSITAQVFKRQKHELSVHAGGGLSTLQYDMSTGKHNNGVGFHIGGGYTYLFMPDWGFRTGLEIALFRSGTSLKDFVGQYEVPGANSRDNYTYYYATDRYNETQQVWFLNVPLMLQYQTGRTYKKYFAVGAKVGLPLKGTASTKKYEIATKGYFPEEGRTYDDLPQFGFGTYEYLKHSSNLDNFKIAFMLSAEAGIKWKVAANNDVYTGAFIDYGLNNIQGTNDKTFVQGAISEDKPAMSSFMESNINGAPVTQKINPFAVGVRVRFTFLQ